MWGLPLQSHLDSLFSLGVAPPLHDVNIMCIKRLNGLCVITVRRVEMEMDGPPGVTRRGKTKKVDSGGKKIEWAINWGQSFQAKWIWKFSETLAESFFHQKTRALLMTSKRSCGVSVGGWRSSRTARCLVYASQGLLALGLGLLPLNH